MKLQNPEFIYYGGVLLVVASALIFFMYHKELRSGEERRKREMDIALLGITDDRRLDDRRR